MRNFRFQLYFSAELYASHPVDSSSGHRGIFWVALGLALAAAPTCLVCLLPPTCLAAYTCPRWMTSSS